MQVGFGWVEEAHRVFGQHPAAGIDDSMQARRVWQERNDAVAAAGAHVALRGTQLHRTLFGVGEVAAESQLFAEAELAAFGPGHFAAAGFDQVGQQQRPIRRTHEVAGAGIEVQPQPASSGQEFLAQQGLRPDGDQGLPRERNRAALHDHALQRQTVHPRMAAIDGKRPGIGTRLAGGRRQHQLKLADRGGAGPLGQDQLRQRGGCRWPMACNRRQGTFQPQVVALVGRQQIGNCHHRNALAEQPDVVVQQQAVGSEAGMQRATFVAER